MDIEEQNNETKEERKSWLKQKLEDLGGKILKSKRFLKLAEYISIFSPTMGGSSVGVGIVRMVHHDNEIGIPFLVAGAILIFGGIFFGVVKSKKENAFDEMVKEEYKLTRELADLESSQQEQAESQEEQLLKAPKEAEGEIMLL